MGVISRTILARSFWLIVVYHLASRTLPCARAGARPRLGGALLTVRRARRLHSPRPQGAAPRVDHPRRAAHLPTQQQHKLHRLHNALGGRALSEWRGAAISQVQGRAPARPALRTMAAPYRCPPAAPPWVPSCCCGAVGSGLGFDWAGKRCKADRWPRGFSSHSGGLKYSQQPYWAESAPQAAARAVSRASWAIPPPQALRNNLRDDQIVC